MKLYRFSPIESKEALLEAITHLHFACHKLCFASFGRYLPVAENIGIFCHYQAEYEFLIQLREELTIASSNWNQKYFELQEPITIPETNDIPSATYKYLYVRKPDPYRHHVGDIDFYLPNTEYQSLKEQFHAGNPLPGARIFPEDRLDMIELHHPNNDGLSYVSNVTMTELVRNTSSSHSPS